MRRVVAQMSVSLDGYFEGSEGDLSWGLVDEELHGCSGTRARPGDNATVVRDVVPDEVRAPALRPG